MDLSSIKYDFSQTISKTCVGPKCLRPTTLNGSLRETSRSPKPKRQKIISPHLDRNTSAFNYPRGCERCLEVWGYLRVKSTEQQLTKRVNNTLGQGLGMKMATSEIFKYSQPNRRKSEERQKNRARAADHAA